MNRKCSRLATPAAVVLLTMLLCGCGEKVTIAPEPTVKPPAAPVVAQLPVVPAPSADLLLESRLKKALAGDPVLGGLAIDVKVVKGTASLWGTVRGKSDKRKVVALVQAVDGVTAVNDNLVVVSGS